MVALEIDTLVPPVFVTVADKDWLVPTVTLPKLREVGLELSCPGVAVPLPDKATVRFGFEASEVTVTVPLALPAEPGANFTLKLVLSPAFSVVGAVDPTRLKPVPLIAI